MSAVKVTIVNYIDYLRVDVDRRDCGKIFTNKTGMIMADDLHWLLKNIFEAMDVENVVVETIFKP